MHRSSSTTRVSDEYFSNLSPALSSQTNSESDLLPILNPQSDVSKKEKYRLRFAENVVHLIPLMLLLCAIILWIFSSPVDMVNKSDSIIPRNETQVVQHVDISLAEIRSKLNVNQGDRSRLSIFRFTRP